VTSFAVMTNGRIDVCSIAPELPYSNVGDIGISTPEGLLNIQPVEAPYTTCDVLGSVADGAYSATRPCSGAWSGSTESAKQLGT
jgi:hypothetical protein